MATPILPQSRSAMRTRCECAQDHAELFSTRVDRSGDCWEWTGPVNSDGYGKASHNRHSWMAHRLAYIAFKGEIPAGLVVDHLCGNRRCVNPEHLEAVTDRVNILRSDGIAAINARKELCKRGHPLSPNGPDQRICITCRNAAQRAVKPMRDDDPRHGTANGYANRKCRCDSCKAAWSAYIAQRRAERRREQLQADFRAV